MHLKSTSDDEGRRLLIQESRGDGLKEVSYLPSETNVRLGAGAVETKSSRAFKMGPS
jgi:hypothetical protein